MGSTVIEEIQVAIEWRLLWRVVGRNGEIELLCRLRERREGTSVAKIGCDDV